ncbi:MAG TPA: glycosyltransferase family 4 protein, partial [Nevskiaceae bacterium]|nr:glycosyltransferase family 4 protein [Nevskiaceae bacterium]
VAERYDIPDNLAAWNERVMRELTYLKSFGLQLVSFPIWDLEALPAMDDPELVPVVSLHTTYKMAKPFKPEWSLRPLYEFNMVERVIAAERQLLQRAPRILANSNAIVDILQREYGVDLSNRHEVIAHGTDDPLALPERAALAQQRDEQMLAGDKLRVLYVGRFEPRKGFDIAAAVAEKLLAHGNIEMRFVGDKLSATWERRLRLGGSKLDQSDNLRFLGVVERTELDDAYAEADLVLTPSRFESFGLVAIEAMAAGRPVLALNAGGLGEVVNNGVDGLNWEDGDGVADSISEAIIALDHDRARLHQLGRAARASFEEKFTTGRMVEGIERFYRESLEQGRKAA